MFSWFKTKPQPPKIQPTPKPLPTPLFTGDDIHNIEQLYGLLHILSKSAKSKDSIVRNAFDIIASLYKNVPSDTQTIGQRLYAAKQQDRKSVV